MTENTKKCRVCGSVSINKNHLFYCQSNSCSSVYWNKNTAFKKIKKDLKNNKELKRAFLIEAGVPVDQAKGHFVYQLRLKGEPNSIYIGMTGLHPYERYLNHIIGYKASTRAKRFATALISFEGPMPYELAKEREPELANELRDKGFNVHGGH